LLATRPDFLFIDTELAEMELVYEGDDLERIEIYAETGGLKSHKVTASI